MTWRQEKQTFQEFLQAEGWLPPAAPAAETVPPELSTSAWSQSVAFRIRNGPHVVAIAYGDDGLLHVHCRTAGGYETRQVCTFDWLIDRLVGPAASERLELLTPGLSS